MQEYTAEIWIRKYLEDKFTGWMPSGTVKVAASNLEQALKNVRLESDKRFPYSSIHLDRIFTETGKVVYTTAWDELGPVVSMALE